MINSIIGGLIYIKVRRVMELFPPRLRTMWKDWELHAMVLLSLTLQMILIFFGNRRKYTNRIWIRIVLWCSYLMADWVATVALGVILDNLGNVVEGNGKDGSLNSDVELTAFWAPFLLLHLGGPDTITAYSLEDNELWLRHLLGLGVETGVALYIFLMAWTGSKLSILSILMLCAGIIKYGERTWALRSASNEEFRASMLTPADPGPNYAKFMQEYSLKQFEGFQVIAEEINEVHVPIDLSSVQNNSNHDKELLMAYNLLQIFKRLFVDLILGVDDRESSQSLFAETDRDKAFKLIEIELGFVYDMLYTKAPVVHSLEACFLRLISFACTCSVLVIFSLADHKHSSVDLFITYLLLCAAVVLEVYAVLLLFSSDWTDLWLCKRRSSSYITKFIACLQLPKPPRWSNSMAQFNALSFYLKDKTTICDGIQKLLCLSKVLEKYQYTNYKKVSCHLKQLIFNHLKTKSEQLKSNGAALDVRPIISCRGSQVLNDYNVTELDWSVKVDFDQSILIWHIATYLCYKVDHPKTSEVPENDHSKLSKRLSQYMIYLLVMHPYMLPVGIGMIRFRDTQAEVVRFFEEYKSTSDNTLSQTHTSINLCVWAMEYLSTRKSRVDKFKACKMLLKVNTAVVPIKVKGDRSKSVLFEGCRLASQLQKALPNDRAKKWEMICNVWVEMLAYAASQCRGNYHAQQLRRGGELLSHVWLLMAHFGLTDQFQISQGHARVKLVVK